LADLFMGRSVFPDVLSGLSELRDLSKSQQTRQDIVLRRLRRERMAGSCNRSLVAERGKDVCGSRPL